MERDEQTEYEQRTKALKTLVKSRTTKFLKNASAVNYILLDHALRVYQDHTKNETPATYRAKFDAAVKEMAEAYTASKGV